MSMEFSRRSFLKLSALTAVAVAGSSLMTGCSMTNPNRPVGKVDSELEVIGKHKLTAPKYENSTLTCNMSIKCTSTNALTVEAKNFAMIVTDKVGTVTKYNNFGATQYFSITAGDPTLDKGDTLPTTVTVQNISLSNTDTIEFRYYPRLNSYVGNDQYNDIYATWVLQDPSKSIYAIEGLNAPAAEE